MVYKYINEKEVIIKNSDKNTCNCFKVTDF